MPHDAVWPESGHGVFAVPPLPRTKGRRTFDFDAAARIVDHIHAGGITRFLYGGNAFLYHVTQDEYECLVGWLAQFPATSMAIPSVGPSFGRAMDQARVIRRYGFTAVMLLPCNDPRDALGLEAGVREIAHATGLPLILYLKSEDAFGTDTHAGLDAIGRLVSDGVAVAIKYAVVRTDPARDPYLDALLTRVERGRVISGIGERPAIAHVRDFGLGGMTTGSGCIAPRKCAALFAACASGQWTQADTLRRLFMPLEDLRDAWGPARVLHHATELSGVAPTGPIPPFLSLLTDAQLAQLGPVARQLREAG
jgi:dihydrodipicolinate synthase/N-acetylneuraminate lyase